MSSKPLFQSGRDGSERKVLEDIGQSDSAGFGVRHRHAQPNSKPTAIASSPQTNPPNADRSIDASNDELQELSLLGRFLEFANLKHPYPHLTQSQRHDLYETQLRRKVRSLAPDDWPFWHPSSIFFIWLSPFAQLGRSFNLALADLPKPTQRITTAKLYPRLLSKWLPVVEREQKRVLDWYTSRFQPNNIPSPFIPFEIQDPTQISHISDKNSNPLLNDHYPNHIRNRFGTFDNFKANYKLPQLQPELSSNLIDTFVSTHPAVTVVTQNLDVVIPSAVINQNQSNPDGLGSEFSTPHSISQVSQNSNKVQSYPPIATIEADNIARKESFPWIVPILTRTLLTPLLTSGVLQVFYAFAILMQPTILKNLAYFLTLNETEVTSAWEGVKWASLLSISTCIGATIFAVNCHGFLDLIYRQMSCALVTVFEKTFSVAGWSLMDDPQMNTGTVTNMLTQDLSNLGKFPWFLYRGLIGPFLIIICLFMMYHDLGYAAFVAGALLFAMLPWQYFSSALLAKNRRQLLLHSDQRVRFVTQIFSGIRIIKAYSWEQALGDQIEELRRKELAIQIRVSALAWLNEIIAYIAPCIITVATITTYIYLTPREEIAPEKCLLIVPYLNTLKGPIQSLSDTMTVYVEYHVSTSRLSKLFGKEEWPVFENDVRQLIEIKERAELDLKNGHQNLSSSFPSRDSSNSKQKDTDLVQSQSQSQSQSKPVVKLNNVDFYWASFDKKPFQTPVLSNISLTINPGEVVAVIGPSAIGKTALLTGILGNLYPQPHKTHQGLPSINNVSSSELVPGQFSLRNSIEVIPAGLMYRDNECGYASQHPFLINNTIRNNIILSSEFDQDKFQACIDAAALGPDLAVLPQGDLTIVSAESGLSGGQQARVAFCRLLYHSHCIKVAVLDDIFASVDSFVAKTMFKKGVRGILKDCGIILALNSHYNFLHQVTKTVYLGPSDDTFWPNVYQQLTEKRQQYEEWAASKRRELGEVIENPPASPSTPKQSLNSPSTTPQTNNNTSDAANDKNNLRVLELSRDSPQNQKGQSPSNPQSPDPFGPLPMSPQMTRSGTNSPRGRNNTSQDGIMGAVALQTFRPPSSVQYIGDIEGLFQLDNALIKTITCALQKDDNGRHLNGEDLKGEENDQNDPKKSDLWLSKFKREEEANTELSRKAGLVIDAQTLKSIDKQLGQKVEGHGDQKASGSQTSPTQANLPPGLLFQYVQAHHSKTTAVLIILLAFSIAIGCQVFRNGTDVSILAWAEDVSEAIKLNRPQSHSDAFWVLTSVGTLVFNILLSAALLSLFLYLGYSSSVHIHTKTINSLFKSTLGYLDTTPMGTIINAMTRDIGLVDSNLPQLLISLVQDLLAMIALLFLTFSTSSLLLLPLVPAVLFISLARTDYHNTSVQLRCLQSSTVQPVLSTFSSLVKGAPVLRSFAPHIGAAFIQKFRSLADDYVHVGHLGGLLNARFTFALGVVAALYTSVLSFGVVYFRGQISSTMALLSISYSLRFTTSLQITLRSLTAVAQAMTSVHRLKLLETTVPQEPAFDSDTRALQYVKDRQPAEFEEFQQSQTEKHNIDQDHGKAQYVLLEDDKTVIDLYHRYHEQEKLSYWPWYGKIVFEDVTLRYRPELPIVLNKCSFTIQPGQHCGLVAPTGAGKSTTLLALMRMISPDSGRILIDDVDITQIGLGDLRSRLGLIPQQSIIFSGTARSNLDPLCRFTEEELWLALSLVGMVPKIEQMGGLYCPILENGSNFSSSERQLLCIARSLLAQPTLGSIASTHNQHDQHDQQQDIIGNSNIEQNSTSPSVSPCSKSPSLQQGSILLADEITSMVSGEHDALVQATIRTAFARSTILVIAHRLTSVIDLDRIIVLRRITQNMIDEGLGSVLEFEVPWILLNNPESQLYQMCMATGVSNFVSLWIKARDAFFRTQKKEKELYNHSIIEPVVNYDNLPQELVTLLKQEARDENPSSAP